MPVTLPDTEEFHNSVQLVMIRLLTMATVDMLVAGLISGDEQVELYSMDKLRELGEMKMSMYKDGSLELELKAVEDVLDILVSKG